MFGEVAFTTEGIVAITGLLATLAGAIAYIFKLLMQAKDDQIKLALEKSQAKSYSEMLAEALAIIETRIAGKVAASGRAEVKPLVPVVAEHNSPASPEQKAVAEMQTARARLTAATLAMGLPARGPVSSPGLHATPAGVVAEQLRGDIASVAQDVKDVPEKVKEKLKEDAAQEADQSPPPGTKP